MRGFLSLEALWQDVKYGVRVLLRQPGFSLVVIVTLALGIGANTAIFSVVNAVLLRALPYRDPSSLVAVWANNTRTGNSRSPVAAANFIDIRDRNRVFEDTAILFGQPAHAGDRRAYGAWGRCFRRARTDPGAGIEDGRGRGGAGTCCRARGHTHHVEPSVRHRRDRSGNVFCYLAPARGCGDGSLLRPRAARDKGRPAHGAQVRIRVIAGSYPIQFCFCPVEADAVNEARTL
jgi:hypothetical protein